MIFVKRQIIIKIFNNNNTLFAELNYAKEFYSNYAKHSHDTLCIAVLKKGEISVEFHNKEVQYIKQNQLIIFNFKEVHVCKNTKVKSSDYFTFHFNKKLIENISDKYYFENNIINDKILYNILIDLGNKTINNDTSNLKDKLESFLKIILNKYAIEKKLLSVKDNNILDDVKEYIIKNIDEQITLDDIASEIGYSKEHIIRIFKKEFGLSPHAFLMNEKVNKVRNILQNKYENNISQLALDIGFYDQSHMIKFFKKSFGMTPNNYK